jgi:hypothetical protein
MFKNKDLVNLYLNQCLIELGVRKCAGHFLRLLETSRLFRDILKKRRDLWKSLYKDEYFPWYLCQRSTDDCFMSIIAEIRMYALYFKPFSVEKIWSFLHVHRIKCRLYPLIYKDFRGDIEWNKFETEIYASATASEINECVSINSDIIIYKSGKICYMDNKTKSITLEDFYRPYLNLF